MFDFKMSISQILTYENPVFCGYLTYGAVLVLKMMAMSILTGRQRRKHAVLTSPEDRVFLKGRAAKLSHEDVDRVRRAHLNDLENILIFFLVSFAYMMTDPDPSTALNLFRLYTAARLAHTFVYAIVVIPQPARGISWFIGYLITGYMAIRTIIHFRTF